jgi:Protein of unknown function (DUF1579)
MKIKLCAAAAAMIILVGGVFAQDQPKREMTAEQKAQMDAWMKAATPSDAHKKLQDMVGTWDAKVTMWPAPGQPPQVSTGTSRNTSILGGRWIQQEFTGSSMGMPFTGIGYTGYDNIKKQYVGTWMDSMTTSMMVSTGAAGSDPNTYEFTSSMDDPMSGKTMQLKEKMTVVDANHQTWEMWSPTPDGNMFKMMQIEYTRKK